MQILWGLWAQHDKTRRETSVRESVQSLAQEIDRWLEERERPARSLATNRLILDEIASDPESAQLEVFFEMIQSQGEDQETFLIANDASRIYPQTASGLQRPPNDTISGPVLIEETGSIQIWLPTDSRSRFQGYAGTQFPADQFTGFISDLWANAEVPGEIAIVTQSGKPLWTSAPDPSVYADAPVPPMDWNTVCARGAWRLELLSVAREALEPSSTVRSQYWLWGLSLGVLAIVGTLSSVRMGFAPIQALGRDLQQRASIGFPIRRPLSMGPNRETAIIASSVNRLLEEMGRLRRELIEPTEALREFPNPVALIDSEGRVVVDNQALHRLIERPDGLRGSLLRESLTTTRGRVPAPRLENTDTAWALRPDGERIPVSVRVFQRPEIFSKGERLVLLVERQSPKPQEAREREQAGILELDRAPFPLIASDTQGTIVHFNREAERLLGYRETELVDRAPLSLVLGTEIERLAGPDSLKDTQDSAPFDIHWEVIGKSGTPVPAHLFFTPFGAPGGRLVAIWDRRGQQAKEERMASETTQARASTLAKTEFLASMSHEIRTPMNAVLGMSSLLLNTRIDKEQREFVETIQKSASALLGFVSDILNYARVESGDIQLSVTACDLNAIIEEALSGVAQEAGRRNSRLEYSIAPDTPSAVRSDRTRLVQMLQGILETSVRLIENGGLSLEVSAHREDQVDLWRLQFIVEIRSDNLAEENLESLLQPFARRESKDAQAAAGAHGLRLAMARSLAHALGGDLRVWTKGANRAQWIAETQAEPVAFRRTLSTPFESVGLKGKVAVALSQSPGARAEWERRLRALGMTTPAEPEVQPSLFLCVDEAPSAENEERMLAAHNAAKGIVLSEKNDPPTAKTFAWDLVIRSDQSPHEWAREIELAVRRAAKRTPVTQTTDAPTGLDSELALRAPLKILVAEDNPINRRIVGALLEKMGYQAQFAENGVQATEAAAKKSFDLILMDIQMPEMDGLEALRQIRGQSQERRPYIAALTANATDDDRERCRQAGFDAFLTKPLKPENLKEAILEANRHRDRQQENEG